MWAAAFGREASPPETCLGKTTERIKVPVLNERQKQTYYGALNLYTQKFLIQKYDKGNSQSTIAFLQYLRSQYPHRIALSWDGASYYRSAEVKTYARISLSGVRAVKESRLLAFALPPMLPHKIL